MTQAGKTFIVVSCNMMPIQHNIFTRARSFDAGKNVGTKFHAVCELTL